MLEHEISMILAEVHENIAGGHYAGKETTQMFFCAGLWWPTLQKDAKEYFQSCDVCKRVGNPSRRDDIPLNGPQVMLQEFHKWAIDFVGPINPHERRSREMYIITMVKYLTRWDEATPTTNCTIDTSSIFLFENVVTRFGCPHILLNGQGTNFLNKKYATLTKEFQIHHQKSTPYLS
jgi:hypothetical protein